jgi:indole-3-glycerol phosphate synthase
LTDEKYFSGSINYLNEIAKTKRVPLLRKDFIIDEMQVLQSKANGADLILLISEVLSASQIKELTHAAHEAGLDVLLEMHSVKQIGKVDFGLNKLVGINNRNLEDFSVSLETTKHVANLIPNDVMVVSESGILAKEHIEFIKTTKASCILVGEFLMAAENIENRIAELNEWRKYED